MHLAQLNIAQLKYPLEDPRLAGFVDNIDRVNLAAERMPGFIWRLQDDSGRSVGIRTHLFGEDSIVNMSVWENVEALESYVWNTIHKQIYNRKDEWFHAMKSHHLVMWWIEEGHQPSLAEASKRLDHLNQNGNSDHAFDWSHLPHVKLWQEQRCS